VHVPKTTRPGDFQKNEKILFYSKRTENCKGEPSEGVDEITFPQIRKTDLDIILRVYVPESEKISDRDPPVAVKME